MEESADDDYWNSSATVSFNFDDDDEQNVADEPLLEDEFKTKISWDSYLSFDHVSTYSSDSNSGPTTSVLSELSLNLILEDIKVSTLRNDDSFNASDIVETILIGSPYNMYKHRSLKHKIELLDAAVAIQDGNTITEVLMYMSKTLETHVFLPLLQKRKVAFQHYLIYLIQRKKMKKINKLFVYCPNPLNLIENFYLGNRFTGSFHENFRNFMSNFGEKLPPNMQSTIMTYNKFISFQVGQEHVHDSPIEQLAFLYNSFFKSNLFTEKYISDFIKQMHMTQMQVEWVILNTYAELQIWNKISEKFTKPNWLTKTPMLRASLSPYVVVCALERHSAPKNTMLEFLKFIPDKSQSLEIAKRVDCYKFVIDYYAAQRDKSSLIEYQSSIPNRSEDYYYLEKILKSDRKWKR